MKRALFFIFLAAWLPWLEGQNVQLHYDMLKARSGKDRDKGFFTSTIEMFRNDSYGSTFFFVDMDFNGYRGISRGYMEFARNISVGSFPLQPRVEFNGGLVLTDTTKGSSIANAWLIGVNYPFKVGRGTAGTYLVYKYIEGNTRGPDFQWTLNWNIPVYRERVYVCGFFDTWTTDKQQGKKAVVLTEPQVWVRAWHQVFLGSETEISHNFYPWLDGVSIFPTAALKVIFK